MHVALMLEIARASLPFSYRQASHHPYRDRWNTAGFSLEPVAHDQAPPRAATNAATPPANHATAIANSR